MDGDLVLHLEMSGKAISADRLLNKWMIRAPLAVVIGRQAPAAAQ